MNEIGISGHSAGDGRGRRRGRAWWVVAGALVLAGSCKDEGEQTDAATGTGTGETAGDTADSSGGGENCGNGVIDGFEACDDGNQVQGDGCNNDCNPSAQVLWTATFDSGAADCAEGVAIDSGNNTIVVGFVSTDMAGDDAWIRKYDPEGMPLWTNMIDNAFGDDRYRDVAVGPDDSIYVAGYVTSDVPTQARNIIVRKLDPDGNELWAQTHNNDYDGSDDLGYGIVVTSDGGVAVVGEETVGLQDSDVWLRKYDGAGNEQWTATYGGAASALDSGRAVTEGPNGEITVTGWETQADGGRAIWVRQYSPTGQENWTQTFNAGSPNGNIGNGIAARSDGSVVVTGSVREGDADTDMWTRAYGAEGGETWTQLFPGPLSGADVGRGVATDGSDAAMVVGTVIVGESGLGNIKLVRLTAAGVILSQTDYGGVTQFGADGYAVAIGPDDNIAFVGCEYDPNDTQSGDILVAKVTP